MSAFEVNLKKVVDNSYQIEIGFGLVDKMLFDIQSGLVGNISRFAIVTDSNVSELYGEKINHMLNANGYESHMIVFEAGEKSKNRNTKEKIEDEMIALGYRRDCCIIAVGGGVVSDMAGFVAATYGRGVPFINFATTLLAAADASIGGKTAVDTPVATNLIGAFNQPQKVYIDIEAWKTLSEQHISNGLAETIKHACLANADLFDYLNMNIEKIFKCDESACVHIAEENCKIKYEVVMKDERELGLREVLNLGHTVGRAIETVSDYKLLHGEAVSIGLVAEVKLAEKYGYCSADDVLMVKNLLDRAKLPVSIPNYINRDDLVNKLYTDKKTRNGKLRFVLQDGIGRIKVFNDCEYALEVPEEDIREIIFDL